MIGAVNANRIQGVVFNAMRGILVDPVRGIAFGQRGHPIRPSRDGYVRLKARWNHPRTLYAHRVIWEAANGPIPEGHDIDHRNGRKSDNRIQNLEPVLPAENARRALRKGLTVTGERVFTSKLTAEQVCRIRKTVGSISCAEWARRLGVDGTTVRAARRRVSWRHIVCHRDGTASARPHPGRVSSRRRPRRRMAKPREAT
jgi:hypothetical protein